MRFAVLSLLLAFPALAQIDSASLRAKFGDPLHRQTFHLPQEFDLAVDYNAYNEVCQLEVPAEMPLPRNFSGGFNATQEMQKFLADLVPHSFYEHVTILTSGLNDHQGKITAQFKAAGCEPSPQPPETAQLDSATLRAKFGEPLNRETFRVRPEIEIAVDYGANRQVCRIEVPALAEYDRQELLTELVPDSMRGKELNRFMMSTGAFSGVSTTEYEHITISQSESGRNDTIHVIFKDPACR